MIESLHAKGEVKRQQERKGHISSRDMALVKQETSIAGATLSRGRVGCANIQSLILFLRPIYNSFV